MNTPAHILIIGAFGPGAMENYYLNGLQKCGVTVSSYDIASDYYSAITGSVFNKLINKIAPDLLTRSLNDKLQQYLHDEQFEVILVFKGMQLYPETIQYLKRHTKILANYNPDHPFHFYSSGSGNKNVLNSIKYYDIYFSYASQITTQLKENYDVSAYTIPFGYDDSNTATAAEMPEVENRILFIGSYDKGRAAFLNKIVHANLDIYGDMKWKTRNRLYPALAKAYQQKALYGSAYKFAISEAAGVINLMREQNMKEQSHNMRTFEVPGYGGVLISQRTDEQLNLFEEDKEAVYFDTVEELQSKMDFLNKNPETVKRIKRAAYQRCITSGYSYNERSVQLFQILKGYL